MKYEWLAFAAIQRILMVGRGVPSVSWGGGGLQGLLNNLLKDQRTGSDKEKKNK